MKLKLSMLAALVAAAFAAQGVVAAEKAKMAKGTDCYEESTEPAAKSDKARAVVKAEAKGAEIECEAGPKAKSTKDRAKVKAEAKAAVKAGKMPPSESQK